MYLDPKTEALIDQEIAEGRIRARKSQKDLLAAERRTGRKNPHRMNGIRSAESLGKEIAYDVSTILRDKLIWND